MDAVERDPLERRSYRLDVGVELAIVFEMRCSMHVLQARVRSSFCPRGARVA